MNITSTLASILKKDATNILSQWLKAQLSAVTLRKDLMKEEELRHQSQQFLALFQTALQSGNLTNIKASEWDNTLGFWLKYRVHAPSKALAPQRRLPLFFP